jgi:hypothetical protein
MSMNRSSTASCVLPGTKRAANAAAQRDAGIGKAGLRDWEEQGGARIGREWRRGREEQGGVAGIGRGRRRDWDWESWTRRIRVSSVYI